MIKNYFKIIWRNMWKNKVFSAINIFGLALGLACSLLILLWVKNELGYDRFYKDTDRIAEIYSRDNSNGKLAVWNGTPGLLAPELKKNYPEVEDAVRFRIVYFLMTEGEKHLNVEGSFADSAFLSVFNFPLLEGNAKTALNDNSGIVITKKLAVKLFGNTDPMGKIVRIDSTANFKVTAVLKDLPQNTRFEYEYILPWAYLTRLGWDKGQTWANSDAETYVLLKQGTLRKGFDAKIQNLIKSHVNSGDGSTREIFTQPLNRAYLYSKPENGKLTSGRIITVNLFTVIAIVILLIACINFMNLSTARSEKRAKETGILKAIGARKRLLIIQFIGESTSYVLIAFVIAIFIVQISLKSFNEVLGVSLAIDFANPYLWLFALLFILVTGLIAGSYPAFYLSSFKPVEVLKGTFKTLGATVTARKILVVSQFTFAIALIICTIIVRGQLKFANDRDAGYNRGKLVYVFSQGDVQKNYNVIKNELISSGAAVAVTKPFAPITRSWATVTGLSWPGSTETDKGDIFLQFGADADFVKTTGAKLLQGRDIDTYSYLTDSSAILLNEAAVKIMHLQHPIGKTIKNVNGINCHVIGVLKNFIIGSPYDEVKPMVIQGFTGGYPVVHFRLNPANTTAADLEKAAQVFKKYNPQYPFDYVFADEVYAQKFKEEQQDSIISAFFAGLTIFISCMGLFGLAACMTENRVKEIGIRKVLGAGVLRIVALLSMDFVKLIAWSILIASPIAWYMMSNWLNGYSYRISIEWWVFAIAGIAAVSVALLTISFQAIKAAIANPIKSLRSE
jgi:putative ABC transport system permease protein